MNAMSRIEIADHKPSKTAQGTPQTKKVVIGILGTKEVAELLKVNKKTVLRLCHRKLLKPLPGIRHKLFTENELDRYLSLKGAGIWKSCAGSTV
jgi:excisionase family DNA binding protein